MDSRILAVVASIVLLGGACSSSQAPATLATASQPNGPVPADAATWRSPGTVIAGSRTQLSRAAAAPDHGEFASYPGNVTRVTGAYTWHRAAFSEAHALNAITSGHLRLTTPDGRLLDVVYDRHVEHDSGDWTWVGHLAGHEGVQTVLTMGAEAIFGSIGQDVGLPLRLTTRDGASWLVETDGAKVAAIDSEATRPSRPDFHVPLQPRIATHAAAAGSTPVGGAAAATATATATAGPVVDLLVGYSTGARQAAGSASIMLTRIHTLVDLANVAYQNSGITGSVRLVHAMEVGYSDTIDNNTAIEELSGYEAGVGPTTPSPLFDDLRAARETYGADLVTLIRDFREPEHGSCGIAWLLGGSLQGIAPGEGWDTLGYSVVSDGRDISEEDSKTYYCRDLTLAHELGHNMGASHDQETAKGDDGTLDNPDDYGAFLYSFGYKAPLAGGNFYTVMAYGDQGQTEYTVFSTPNKTTCGGKACGLATADNARTLNSTMPVVAGFRDAVVPGAPGKVRMDIDGDGASDLFWRNTADGRDTIWLSANRATQRDVAAIPDQAWRVVAIADFDGDGAADVYWRNRDNGQNSIWASGDSATPLETEDVTNTDWLVVGAGDFDGDGEDDILWRNPVTGANTIWPSGTRTGRVSLNAIVDSLWEVVAVGDFDGDGEADIFWRHAGTGKNTIWYSGLQAQRASQRRVGDLAWKVAGVGDFDGDGSDDILWRNDADGRNTIWKSANGSTKQAVNRVSGTSWQVAATGDFDGDGVADIFWRNTANGDNVVWPDADRGQRQVIDRIGLDWDIVP